MERLTVEVVGTTIAYLRRGGEGMPAIFVHGVPTDSRQWLPFLERMNGPAVAIDLPGFGGSQRPDPARFDYSLEGLAATLREFLDALEIDDFALVAQDWGGGLGLLAARPRPERLRRLVLFDSVPLLPGYRWHRVARIWRRRPAGELLFAALTRRFAELTLREARPAFKPMPEDFVDLMWSNLRDAGTQRAILDLYRSADPEVLADAGSRLGEFSCPALVMWGAHDPYVPVRFASLYAGRLPGADLVELHDAGHWPWLDRPDLISRTVSFLSAGDAEIDSAA